MSFTAKIPGTVPATTSNNANKDVLVENVEILHDRNNHFSGRAGLNFSSGSMKRHIQQCLYNNSFSREKKLQSVSFPVSTIIYR
jgi:hypothetical protein